MRFVVTEAGLRWMGLHGPRRDGRRCSDVGAWAQRRAVVRGSRGGCQVA